MNAFWFSALPNFLFKADFVPWNLSFGILSAGGYSSVLRANSLVTMDLKLTRMNWMCRVLSDVLKETMMKCSCFRAYFCCIYFANICAQLCLMLFRAWVQYQSDGLWQLGPKMKSSFLHQESMFQICQMRNWWKPYRSMEQMLDQLQVKYNFDEI